MQNKNEVGCQVKQGKIWLLNVKNMHKQKPNEENRLYDWKTGLSRKRPKLVHEAHNVLCPVPAMFAEKLKLAQLLKKSVTPRLFDFLLKLQGVNA